MKKTITNVLLFFFCLAVNAQDSSKVKTDNSQEMTAEAKKSCLLHRNAIQLGIGTTGIGLDYRHRFSTHLGFRLGGSYLLGLSNLDVSEFVAISKKSKSTMEVNLNNAHLLLEISPFACNGFRLITGIGYISNANGKINTFFVDSLGITNTKTYAPQEVGTVKTNIDYGSQVAPYLGIGLGNAVPKRRIGINVDIGYYFLKAPSVNVIGTNLLENNAHLGPALQAQLETYTWLPNFQLNLNIRL